MNAHKKILILSDSVALPRNEPEVCVYEDTWPYLLRQNEYVIHQVSIGGATSADLLSQINYHIPFNPDIIILHVGVVDCAPRFMTKIELGIMKRIPIVGKKMIGLMNNNRVRQARKITYVPISQFNKNIRAILSYFKDKLVFVVGIVPAPAPYERLLPGITENINNYNDVLRTYPNFVSLDHMDRDALMSDYHHVNALGHKYIFETLSQELNGKLEG